MANIPGTDGPDVLQGTESNDSIDARGGNDQVFGRGGNDSISGGIGNDVLYGQFGNDNVDGDAGDDVVDGGEGDDNLQGGDGSDVLLGRGGADDLYGEAGNDTLLGESGQDRLYGGDGVDFLLGGADGDTLDGGPGNDWLNPGSGSNELIYGRDGFDTLMRDVPARLAPRFFTNLDPASGDTSFRGLFTVEAYDFVDGHYTRDQQDLGAQAYRLYRAAFNRAPDAHGLSFQLETLIDGALNRPGGASLAQVAQGFVSSAEFLNTYGALDDAAFTAQLYRNVLGREGSPAEIAYYVNLLPSAGRGAVLLGFSESPENINNTRDAIVGGLPVPHPQPAQVARLYDTVFGRLPDAAGLAYYDNLLENSAATLQDIARSFVSSPEFQARYGGLDDRGFAAALYQNALDRPGTAAELDYYAGVIPAGGRVNVLLGFSESLEHVNLLAPTMPSDGFLLGG